MFGDYTIRDFNYRVHFNSSFGDFYTLQARGREEERKEKGKENQNDNMNFPIYTHRQINK